MAAPTLVDLSPEETKRRYNALSDDDKHRAAGLKRSGRNPSDAVQIIEAQNAAYEAQQPMVERLETQAESEPDARKRLGLKAEAVTRRAGATALGAGQVLSLGTDKLVADIMGDKDYRARAERYQQDAPASTQLGMGAALVGDLVTGAPKAIARGAASAFSKGGPLTIRLLKAAKEPALVGGAGGVLGGVSNVPEGAGILERVEGGIEGGAKGTGIGAGLGGLGGVATAAAARGAARRAAAAEAAGLAAASTGGMQKAFSLYGKAGKIPVLGKLLPGAQFVGMADDAMRIVKAMSPEAPPPPPPPPPAAPAPKPAPQGPFKMPAVPKQAAAVPIEAIAPPEVPTGVTQVGSEAMRLRALASEKDIVRALSAGNEPEQVARSMGVSVDDVKAVAQMSRTKPQGPTAADAPAPQPPPMPEPAQPSPFTRAQPAQPAQLPAAAGPPPGISAERWKILQEAFGPGDRQRAGTVAARQKTPTPPKGEPTTQVVTPEQVVGEFNPAGYDLVQQAMRKLGRTQEAARAAGTSIGERVAPAMPGKAAGLQHELSTSSANPAQTLSKAEQLIDLRRQGGPVDPSLVEQAIARRRGEEAGETARMIRLGGSSVVDDLVGGAIAKGARTVEDVQRLTGLNVREVQAAIERHGAELARAPKPLVQEREIPVGQGEKPHTPVYKDLFGEPLRMTPEMARDRAMRLVQADRPQKTDLVRKVMELRAQNLQPQQIVKRINAMSRDQTGNVIGPTVDLGIIYQILKLRPANEPIPMSIYRTNPGSP